MTPKATYLRASDPGTARRSRDNGNDQSRQQAPPEAEPVRQAATLEAWLTLLVVAGGLFLAVISTTVVSVALPTIGRNLHAGPAGLEWIVDAYVVIYASLLLPGGALGDRLGRKGLFMIGIALFGVGSAICAVAPSIGTLLAGRVIQGVGPALLVPGSLTIIRATFEDPRQRALAIGLWSMASGLALAIGPALGGLIVEYAGWRWVFAFNIPLAAVLAGLAARFVPRLKRVPVCHQFDWAGAAFGIGAIAAVAFAVIEGQTQGWGSPEVVAVFAFGVGAGSAFVIWERRLAEPLIDVSLFTRPAFAAANLAAFVVFFAFVGAIVYFSAYFQHAQGHSPISAGFDVAAIGVAYAIATVLSGKLVGRIGERIPLVVGLVIAGAATLGLLRLDVATGIDAIWWNFAILGAGIGLCGTPMSTIAMSAVDVGRAGMASAVVNAVRQVGQVFGVAVLGALVYAHLPSSGGGGRLDPNVRSLFIGGLHNALWVSGLALLAAAAASALLLKHDQAHPNRTRPQQPERPPIMTEHPGTLAATYFQAWKAKDFATLRLLLADDVTFRGPMGSADEADTYMQGMQAMAQIITDLVIHKTFVDGPDVLTWFDLHTTAAPPCPTANWTHVKNGKIATVQVTFDARPFPAPGAGSS